MKLAIILFVSAVLLRNYIDPDFGNAKHKCDNG